MTPNHGLLFEKSESHEVEIYTNASWVGEQTDISQLLATALMFGGILSLGEARNRQWFLAVVQNQNTEHLLWVYAKECGYRDC